MKRIFPALTLLLVLFAAIPAVADCPRVINIDDPPCVDHAPVYLTVLESEPDWCLYDSLDVALVQHDSSGNVLWYYVFPSSYHGDTFYFHNIMPYATLMDVSGCGLVPSKAICGDC